MVKIKLYSLAQPFKAAATMPGVLVKGATGLADSAASAVNTGFTSGLDGVFSLGKGLRDFILRGTVVELAVAVVLGTAFTNLIASATADLITPLIAAIFQGTNFQDLYFVVNSSMFKYGDLINAFLTFVFVVLVLYFCVVVPLEKLQYAAFKHKAIMRDCPFCLEEISLAATRCKHCTAHVPLDEQMKRTLELATAAIEAQEQQRQQCWYVRMFASCCCHKPRQASVPTSPPGDATHQHGSGTQLTTGDMAIDTACELSQNRQYGLGPSPTQQQLVTVAGSAGSSASASCCGSTDAGWAMALTTQPGSSAYTSPQQSFTEGASSISIDVQQLAAGQQAMSCDHPGQAGPWAA